ncbi:MAG TPA: DUF1587 domain-containing protein [Polyangiaceae bacterium]
MTLRHAIAAWLGGLSALSCSAPPRLDAVVGKPVQPNSEDDPGHPALHRLNRAEYDNSVHELLGTELRPAEGCPSDDHGFGFDNNSGVLSISPVQLQLYEQAAQLLAAEALAPLPPAPTTQVVEGETLHSNFGGQRATAFKFSNNGSVVANFNLPAPGGYRVIIRAWGEQAGSAVVRMRVSVAGHDRRRRHPLPLQCRSWSAAGSAAQSRPGRICAHRTMRRWAACS